MTWTFLYESEDGVPPLLRCVAWRRFSAHAGSFGSQALQPFPRMTSVSAFELRIHETAVTAPVRRRMVQPSAELMRHILFAQKTFHLIKMA